jgi:site-specific DNA-methyltransferase (cytosine-N4-specific)
MSLSETPAAKRARAARVRRGEETEAAARAHSKAQPSLQGLLQFPLLEAIAEAGGRARPRDLYQSLADRLNLDDGARETQKVCGDGQRYNVFEQQVRWARQTAVAQGLIATPKRGIWELADPAYDKLKKARRGQVVLIYTLDDGIALWAHAEEAASAIEPGSVDLVLTSPPYPVIKRAYGRFTVPEWLAWMSDLVGLWRELITERGTIAVNLMDVFVPGSPNISPYVERFTLDAIDRHGLHLAGRMPWHSPTKLPNLHWAVKERVRPKNTLEHILLFSKHPHPDWDTRRLPRESYAKRTMSQERQVRGRETRPSGYIINADAFRPTEDGPIPGNLLIAGGVSGNNAYARRCAEAGMPVHPARFPEALPKRTILMTTKPGGLVYDPMAGSNTTGKVALELGRRFISSEPMLAYAQSSALRFDHRPDFRLHLKPPAG